MEYLQTYLKRQRKQKGKQKRPSEREGKIAGNLAAGFRAEIESGTPFQPAEIKIGPPVYAVQQCGQSPVQLEKRIATHEFLGIGGIREFQLIAGNGVAKIAESQKAIVGDPVQQLVHHFEEGGSLRRIPRLQANVLKRIGENG